MCEWDEYLKKKRVRLSNSAEKSSGSYYLVVFNWDLIDPSIIHRDCQWAVYAVYATSVSLSFHRILTMKYNLCFFFVLRCIFIYFFSFLILLFSLHQLDRASSAMLFFSSSSKNYTQWRPFFHFEKIEKWSIEKSCAIKSTRALTFNLVIIHLFTAIYLQFNCFSQREISIIERVKERCMFQQTKKRKEKKEKRKWKKRKQLWTPWQRLISAATSA